MSCEAPLGRVLAVGRLVGIVVAAASAKDKGAIRVIDVADGEMGPDKLAFDTVVDVGVDVAWASGLPLDRLWSGMLAPWSLHTGHS